MVTPLVREVGIVPFKKKKEKTTFYKEAILTHISVNGNNSLCREKEKKSLSQYIYIFII